MSAIVLDASKNEEYMARHGESITSPEEEESSVSKRKRVYREVYISPEELAELREVYSHVIVQDFEDGYHLSREERQHQKEKFGKFLQLRQRFTKKIRKIDKYVEACRLCMDIVNQTAEENGIYDPEEFKRKVFKGDITINGLNFPKYQGKDKKKLNWEYITDLIMNPEMSLKDLTKDTTDDFDIQIPCFNPEEFDAIMQQADANEMKLGEESIYEPNIKDSDGIARIISKKERKDLMKNAPGYMAVVKEIQKAASRRRKGYQIYNLEPDEERYIQEYDAKTSLLGKDKPPKFHGDASNPDDVNAYIYKMEQYERETEIVEYNNRYITLEEKEDLEYKELLEQNGWNLRNVYGNKERERMQRKKAEADKKKIKQLKEMLKKVQDRANAEDADMIGSDGAVNKKKKKNKKGKKRAKKMNEILLDAFDDEDEDMKAYKKRMKNMKWGE